jgi:hypothetical protein
VPSGDHEGLHDDDDVDDDLGHRGPAGDVPSTAMVLVDAFVLGNAVPPTFWKRIRSCLARLGPRSKKLCGRGEFNVRSVRRLSIA